MSTAEFLDSDAPAGLLVESSRSSVSRRVSIPVRAWSCIAVTVSAAAAASPELTPAAYSARKAVSRTSRTANLIRLFVVGNASCSDVWVSMSVIGVPVSSAGRGRLRRRSAASSHRESSRWSRRRVRPPAGDSVRTGKSDGPKPVRPHGPLGFDGILAGRSPATVAQPRDVVLRPVPGAVTPDRDVVGSDLIHESRDHDREVGTGGGFPSENVGVEAAADHAAAGGQRVDDLVRLVAGAVDEPGRVRMGDRDGLFGCVDRIQAGAVPTWERSTSIPTRFISATMIRPNAVSPESCSS